MRNRLFATFARALREAKALAQQTGTAVSVRWVSPYWSIGFDASQGSGRADPDEDYTEEEPQEEGESALEEREDVLDELCEYAHSYASSEEQGWFYEGEEDSEDELLVDPWNDDEE
jgi:hypothetical protein